jgi:hypothetical protein
MNAHFPTFTISRVAEILGYDRKTIREQFERGATDAGAAIVIKGQTTHAWPLHDFPPALRTKIEAVARKQGFDDAERFLKDGRVRWQPPIPLGKIGVHHIERAQRRCPVLAPVIQANRNAPLTQIAAEGHRAWSANAGYVHVSDRTVLRWIERAMERDRGFEDWSRWAIYLDDEIATAPTGRPGEIASILQTPHLAAALDGIKIPANPSSAEREYVWLKAMQEADAIAASGVGDSVVQDVILRVLAASGVPLALNREAMRVAYRRKRARWVAGERTPSAIADKRPARNADRKWSLPQDDRLHLLRRYLECGDLASAFRLAMKNRTLTSETLERFTSEPRDKSYVPSAIRSALASDLLLIDQQKLGPRAARMNGAWLERSHDDYEPGDWWQGDDLTPPVYFWDESEAPFYFGRGQMLAMIDVRVLDMLGWCLISANNYNARAIRSLITQCHDEHGLPRRGFYFEHGKWEKARVLKGRADAQQLDLRETELGLQEFVEFRHADVPRAKVIEGIFGLLQNRMEGVQGYCGRDERRDCPEHIRQAKLEIDSGRAHPSKYFLHKNEWVAQLEQIIADYRNEKHGVRAKMIPGQSPAEAYGARRTDDIIWLPENSRHLLANHRMPVKVSRNGIRLPAGLGGGLYRGESTGSIVGREVLAWVHPDNLDTITITDPDRTNPRLVERADSVSAFTPNDADLCAANANLANHANYGNTLYRIVVSASKRFRPVTMDRATVLLGAEMKSQAAARQERQQVVARGRRQVEAAAIKSGLPIRPGSTPEQLERQKLGAELRRQALEDAKREQAAQTYNKESL